MTAYSGTCSGQRTEQSDSLSRFGVTGKVKSVEIGGSDNLELWVHKTDGTLKVVSIVGGLTGDGQLFIDGR